MTIRPCGHCGNPGVELRAFSFDSLDVAAISCSCGSAICLPAPQVQAAWNLRVTDSMLDQCLIIVKTMILILGDYDVDSARERELVNRITEHLGGQQL